MAEPRREPSEKPEVDSAKEHFKREGPAPAKGDTGDTVEEMNEVAEDSLVKNIDHHKSD